MEINLSWCQGYECKPIFFVDNDTICHQCGNNVKLYLASDKPWTRDYYHDLRNIGHVAVHSFYKQIAVCETDVIDPKIQIYSSDDFQSIGSPLSGTADLEITALAFSASDFLYATTGVPNFQLVLWDFRKRILLAKTDICESVPYYLSVSPLNWRQTLLLHDSFVTVYETERCANVHVINSKSMRLPTADSDVGIIQEFDMDRSRVPTRASTANNSRGLVEPPIAAIAGVEQNFTEDYTNFKDSISVQRMVGVSAVWSDVERDFYIGCANGCLVKYDDDRRVIRVLYNSTIIQRPVVQDTIPEDEEIIEPTRILAFNHLALSKQGLYAAGEDGIVRFYKFSSEGFIKDVSEVFTNANPITALAFNTPHTKLAIGIGDGSIEIKAISDNEKSLQLYSAHHGTFVGVSVLYPGAEKICSVRQDGTLQIWKNKTVSEFHSQGNLLASLSLPAEVTSFCANPTCGVVFTGGEDGFLSAVDVSNTKELRLLFRERLHHNAPILRLAVDPEGDMFVTASSDGCVYVGSAKPSNRFLVYGFTQLEGTVQDVAVRRVGTTVQIVLLSTRDGSSSNLTYFEISKDLRLDPVAFRTSELGELDTAYIKKMAVRVDSIIQGCAFTKNENPVVFSIKSDTRQLLKFPLPGYSADEEQLRTVVPDHKHSPDIFFDDPNVRIFTHLSDKLLIVYGQDGFVYLIDYETETLLGKVLAHCYASGGVVDVVLSTDGKFLVTSGNDGCLNRFVVMLPSNISQSVLAFQSAFQADFMKTEISESSASAAMKSWVDGPVDVVRRDSATEEDPPAYPPGVLTWRQKQEQLVFKEEDKVFDDNKKQLRDKLKNMRSQIQAMVDANAKEEDIEKLDPYEFELDLDEQSKFTTETDAEVAKIRDTITFENLAKQFLADVIKKECWDNMEVKGRSIVSFNTALEVNNYPMRLRSKEEEELLAKIVKRREIEMSDMKDRLAMLEVKEKEQATEADGENEEEEKADGSTLQGSSAAKVGGGSDLMYSQFELHSREQKINQVVLLQDSIYRIKDSFNKEFSAVYKRKEQELTRIKERNQRVKKIVGDLNVDQNVVDPEFTLAEKPEGLFTVSDHEVKVERYLTPEQKEKLEAERLAEEERKRKERMDNWRERGLDYMMGGVLEVKKEDELKKDIPKPAFMSTKAEEEWSEDEKRAAVEYERKVVELNEEREKYRRQLDAELKKLNTQTEDNMQLFDEELHKLFQRRIRAHAAIVQEELKIYRLRTALLADEEFESWESQLRHLEGCKKAQVEKLLPMIEQARKLVKAQDDAIHNAKAELEFFDKNISGFKKEFTDVPAVIIDHLFKLYKRKMPISQKMKAGTGFVESPFNPYGNRPSTAVRNDSNRKTLDAQMKELEMEKNIPEGLDHRSWEHFCLMRREKRHKEILITEMNLSHSEFQAFVAARESELQKLQNDVDNLRLLLERLVDDRAQFIHNLDVQLLLRQGQVEVEPNDGFIHDFSECLLLHRRVIEDLNAKIRELGEAKVQFMTEAKDSKKTFRRLEWELKVMRMQAEDLIQKMKEVNSFKISREIQRYLASDDYDGLINNEIQKLDQAIVLMKKHHEKMVKMKENRLLELSETKAGIMDNKNAALDEQLGETNVSVNERINIDSVNAEKRDEAFAAQQRYKQILQRQRLVDLAKAQAKEVAVLRAEVERLRMRTFPALVHNH